MLQPSRAPRSEKSEKPTLCTIGYSSLQAVPSHTCHTTAPSSALPFVRSSPLPARGLHSPALLRPSSSNPVAEVPKEAPEVSMLLGDPALCARARHALGRPGAMHRRRRTRRCGTRLHVSAAVAIARRRPPHRRSPPPAGHGDESEQVSRDPGEDAQLGQVGRVSRLLEMPLPSLLGN
jgi:hypothetical protein